jgi:hypothetical protein
MKYPKWFPYPSSWLNAILLTLLFGFAIRVIEIISKGSFNVADFLNYPKLLIQGVIVALLSPIPVIAVAHHLLYKMIAIVFPKLHDPTLGNLKGWFPGLLSWWEGVCGYVVATISMLITLWVGTLIHPMFGIDLNAEVQPSTDDLEQFYVAIGLTWFFTTASLYQFAHLVEQKMKV